MSAEEIQLPENLTGLVIVASTRAAAVSMRINRGLSRSSGCVRAGSTPRTPS